MNVKRIPVAIDCDGVLSDFIGYCLPEINRELGTRHTRDDVTSWHTAGWCPAAVPIVDRIMADGRWVADCRPLPGAVDASCELAERFEVHILTSIPQSAKPTRKRWLNEHGFAFDKLHVCAASAKPALTRTINALALVEDRTDTLLNLADLAQDGRATALPILIDQPWNRKFEHPDIFRFDSFPEWVTFAALARQAYPRFRPVASTQEILL